MTAYRKERRSGSDVHELWLGRDNRDPESLFSSIQQHSDARFVTLHLVEELSSKDDILFIADLNNLLRTAGYKPLLGERDAISLARLHIFGVLSSFEDNPSRWRPEGKKDRWRFPFLSRSWSRSRKKIEIIRSAPALIGLGQTK
jgi:hypothetical protein